MSNTNQKILSKNDLFKGQLIDKPKRATYIFGPDGEPIYTCPNCKDTMTAEECDVIGAEDGCLFCNSCNREFEMPEIEFHWPKKWLRKGGAK
jgi:hypothetical protein